MITDDQGNPVPVPARVRRIVSLVPSLTEAVAVTAPELLVGATDWCTHPPGLDVTRVRGTKNPDLDRVLGLRPDLVLANFEENRADDLATLRAAGVAVFTTVIRTLPEAFASLARMLRVCGLGEDEPGWLREARRAWAADSPYERRRAVIPIWRRPWMVLGRETFAGDLLGRLGVVNAYGQAADRYPKVTLAELLVAAPDMVILPDEPYAFGARDGPEAFPGLPVALVSGRHLEWYGPSLADAPAVLGAQLASARRG